MRETMPDFGRSNEAFTVDVETPAQNAPACPPEARVVVDRKALTNDALGEPQPKPQPKLAERVAQSCRSSLAGAPSFLLGLFPCTAWVRSYNVKSYLIPDVLAGLSTAVLHVPQGLVSAIIAGVDPVYGLYSSLFPALVYVVMGSSPYISMGMFPVTALMTGAVVKRYSGSVVAGNMTVSQDNLDDLSLEGSATGVAISLTLLTGLIQVCFWMVRLDRLAAIVSPAMAEGFLTGCAVMVIVSQLPSVFGSGVSSSKGLFGTPLTIYYVAKSIALSNLATVLLSLAAFVVLGVSKAVFARQLKRVTAVPLPSDLILVAVATVASYLLELDSKYNVKVIGRIAAGFPGPRLPPVNDLVSLLPDAVAIAIVQFVSAFSIADLFGRKQRIRADASQEMLAYGVSSVVGSFFLCIPTGSALARSVVLKNVGAKTQVSGLVSSVFVAVTLMAFAPFFRPLPECILGAVIIVVLIPMLFKLRNLRSLWTISKCDVALWSLSFVCVVLLDATYGLLVGTVLGLLIIFLRLNGHRGTRLEPRRPDVFVASYSNLKRDKVVIYRFGSPLCFATHNSIVADIEEIFKSHSYQDDKVHKKLRDMEEADIDATPVVRAIVIDCAGISFLDSSGVRSLDLVAETCGHNNCLLFLAALQDSVLATIKSQESLVRKIGLDHITPTIQDAVTLANYEIPQRVIDRKVKTYL
ncbi:solute carrier family 26 member 10-like [Haemaphysalis longicornis]